MPDMTKPFILETDTSKWAIGAMLLQKQEDGQIHPCGYLSHALTQTEQNWQIYDCELYTIIYALDEWKYLLLGGEHTLTIHCDHKNLTYYHTPQQRTARQARWWTSVAMTSAFDQLQVETAPGRSQNQTVFRKSPDQLLKPVLAEPKPA